MTIQTSVRSFATALVAGLSLLLTGCFVTPGKFTSELVLTKDDRFTFTYEGEIFFLGLSGLAKMGATSEEFEPEECYSENGYDVRECTEAELAEQREVWELNAPIRAAEAQEQAKQMGAIMGGIDPSDPEAAAELAALLSRQRGWEQVIDKGDGVFDVRYSVSGELGHDFMFPVLEGFPTTNPFVQVFLRNDALLRINAPGFAPQQNDTNPMGAMIGGMAGLGGLAALSSQAPNGDEMPNIPAIEGTFTIVTDGEIKANNTDEGATVATNGQRLEWEISPRTKAAPTALIDLSR
ncbi:MAG: hypothetical protein AAGI28_01920 [Pseudomonadota bacterium]